MSSTRPTASDLPQAPGAKMIPIPILRRFWTALFQLFSEFGTLALPRHSAGLAYYTIFSLSPLVVIAIVVAAFFAGKRTAEDELSEKVTEFLGEAGAQVIQQAMDAMQQVQGEGLALVISLSLMFLGASQIFTHLHWVMNRIWLVARVQEKGGMLRMVQSRVIAFVMVASTGLLIVMSIMLETVIKTIDRWVGQMAFTDFAMVYLTDAVWFVVVAGLFTVLYRFLPDIKLRFRDTWRGGVLTAAIFTVARHFLGMYLTSNAAASSFGAAGSLIILLLYIYWSSQIVFLGALFSRQSVQRRNQMPEPTERVRYQTAL